MIRRAASEQLVSALKENEFWRNIVKDTELQPEIRDDKITVYYRAAALLREMSLNGHVLTASIREAYVPVVRRGGCLTLTASDGGLQFDQAPGVLAIAKAEEKTLEAYKMQIEADQGPSSEGSIVQAICDYPRNLILDQEIAFQDSDSSRDKIDLCCIAPDKKLVFVEVKRLDDDRLQKDETTQEREVVGQLKAYCSRIEENQSELIETYRNVLRLKQSIGLGDRYEGVAPNDINELVKKPVLVIGQCSRNDVRRILDGDGEWEGFVAAVQEVSSALILCGTNGCAINLSRGRQKKVF